MLGDIKQVDVFPEYLEITFDSFSLTLPQTCSSSARPDIESEKERIAEMMRCRPKITAKEIAGEMGVSISRVNRRIIELKKEGRIRYSTPNGRGQWIVPDGRES